ncbi:hypothetical protein [Nevskia soli]|uniref:hypothetical protein n=1 Tax=Nevskia soli TaxID=418856 RepID=UPI0012FC8269|nr:hypothetical protein [Nevskia soli]
MDALTGRAGCARRGDCRAATSAAGIALFYSVFSPQCSIWQNAKLGIAYARAHGEGIFGAAKKLRTGGDMKTALGAVFLVSAVLGSPAILADDPTGTAAGSTTAASNTAAGSTTTAVVTGVVTAVVIGAIVAGSSDNNGSSTTSTTSTH